MVNHGNKMGIIRDFGGLTWQQMIIPSNSQSKSPMNRSQGIKYHGHELNHQTRLMRMGPAIEARKLRRRMLMAADVKMA